MILDHGADPKHSGETGRQPIHVAAAHSGSIVKRLVDIGCDVNTQDAIHGNTPLHIACSMCYTETEPSLTSLVASFSLL
jgi:ankyrin repeat protein